MKKLSFLLVTVFALACAALYSCGSDEPKGALGGTWVLRNVIDTDQVGTLTFKFNGNKVTYIEKWTEYGEYNDIDTYEGTCVIDTEAKTVAMIISQTDNDYHIETYEWLFDYELSGGKLTLTPANSTTRGYWGSSSKTFTQQ